ncbi:MAG: DinB family protein [Anaerolineales bacterium]|nr:DinB family protein [Anaerolineales bacterium]MCA9928255.1 DinB family protein [Anaerolineales bacterium]
MITFAAEFIDRLRTLHDDIKKSYAGLPDEALDWAPGPEMNSFNVLITHTAGAERYWIGDMVGRDDSGRVRSTEFETTGLHAADLDQRLDEVLAHSEGVVAQLALTDLAVRHMSPRHNHEFTAAWCLLHALEHTAVHLGHLQVMRQFWLQQHP